jgi:hypothetical protein
MLDALHDIVQESAMIRSIPVDRIIYRIRAHKNTEECTTRETLGPPPSDKAPTNRMSAAGVSVFYGAFEMATAVAEARVSMPPEREWVLTGAAWQCTRPLQVLDLSELPPVPSIFEASREWRGAILFLREFVKSISAPVVHDGGEHVEYVPTQVLTEYFRKEVSAPDGSPLDGIVYPSARRRGGRSLVVFRSREELDRSSHTLGPRTASPTRSDVGDASSSRTPGPLDSFSKPQAAGQAAGDGNMTNARSYVLPGFSTVSMPLFPLDVASIFVFPQTDESGVP